MPHRRLAQMAVLQHQRPTSVAGKWLKAMKAKKLSLLTNVSGLEKQRWQGAGPVWTASQVKHLMRRYHPRWHVAEKYVCALSAVENVCEPSHYY